MKRIRYLSLLMLLLCSISMMGQGWTPTDNPPDPGLPPTKLTLQVNPADAGSTSGSGKFTPETRVNVNTYGNTGFRFVNWTDEGGNVVSESRSFSFQKGETDETLTANYEFDPTAPSDPDEAWHTLYFYLTLVAEKGGSVSGGGRYQAGKSVTVKAYMETGYEFVGWFDEEEALVSSSASYRYTTTAEHRTLTARFRFNPNSPAEPSDPILKHGITAVASEGGSTNFSYQRLLEGTSVTLTAYANTGYIFVGWYLNGELYTTLQSFSYTIGNENVSFEARFKFSPSSPDEPMMPVTKKYSYYLMNKVCKPGDLVQFPVYLTSLDELCDMTFQLTFDEALAPEMASLVLSAKAAGYNLSYTEEEPNVFVVSLIGGRLPAGNTQLLTINVPILKEMPTGTSYQVKINQVSVTETNGETQTASTRNGRVSVYKRGDTNGDNQVDVIDVTNFSSFLAGDTPEVFIDEVSDVNEDGDYSVVDVTGICEIISEGVDAYEDKLNN